jgi:outer membrane protein OmpA-like peptidoglycan-associated protein
MKREIYLIVLAFIAIMNIYPEEKNQRIDFRLIADFNICPYFYDFNNKLFGDSLNGSIFAGAGIDRFSIGAEIYENYVSFSSDNNPNGLYGAWNIIRGTFSFYFKPIDWFQVKAGLGGAYLKSAFTDNADGTISRNEGGISFISDFIFTPFEYFGVKQVNRLDIFFSPNAASPLYYGGLNCSFHQYFNFLSLYVEAGLMTFVYNGKPEIRDTAIFVCSVGVSVDQGIFQNKNQVKEKVESEKKTSEEKNESVKIEEKKAVIESDKNEKELNEKQEREKIEALEKERSEKEKAEQVRIAEEKTAQDKIEQEKAEKERVDKEKQEALETEKKAEKEKKTVQLLALFTNNILFYPDSDRIMEKSYPLLDEIVKLLSELDLVKVELCGYTNNLKNPDGEYKLSVKRVEEVEKYLLGKGVDSSRIKITGYGSRINTTGKIENANRKVEFRIIESMK